MRAPALEVLYSGLSAVQDMSQQARLKVLDVVVAMADEIIMPGDVPGLFREQGNSVVYMSGEHGGLRVDKPRTRIKAFPGAIFNRLVVVEPGADTWFTGCHFKAGLGENNEDRLVDVLGTSTVVWFTDCIFERGAGFSGECVRFGNGAVGNFSQIHCFPATAASGDIINNPGNPLDVGLFGLRNETGRPTGNATLIFGT